MFSTAVLIGIYAYLIFLTGLLGFLSFKVITTVTTFYLIFIILTFYKKFTLFKISASFGNLKPLEKLLLVLLLLFAGINLVGAAGPEIFYDALWYHLTLPKLYLQKAAIYHIPGNLLYYNEFPRLVEMLYTAALVLTNEIGAKIIHYLFGVMTTTAIIVLGKKFFNLKVALVAAVIFYSNLAVAWQSTTAYVDLARTFFEALAFFYFLSWWQNKTGGNLIKTGILAGLAMSTKLFAAGSIAILASLIFFYSKKDKVINLVRFALPATIISLPWFLSAYLTTGNPIYPVFSGILSPWHDFEFRGILNFFADFVRLSNFAEDWTSPISPIYLVFLPLTIIPLLKFPIVRVIGLYSLLTYIYWYLTPRTGGTRFILPYLPTFSLFVASIFYLNLEKFKVYQKIAVFVILIVAGFNLLIRTYINAKNIPVILGLQTKHDFLVQNLDFTNAFYDVDGYLGQNIGKNDKVLIVGGQNLYYVNFPFTHESFGEDIKYNYILTQYKDLPEKYGHPKLIYENPKTFIKLYKLD